MDGNEFDEADLPIEPKPELLTRSGRIEWGRSQTQVQLIVPALHHVNNPEFGPQIVRTADPYMHVHCHAYLPGLKHGSVHERIVDRR
jgi:hypothetical protein